MTRPKIQSTNLETAIQELSDNCTGWPYGGPWTAGTWQTDSLWDVRAKDGKLVCVVTNKDNSALIATVPELVCALLRLLTACVKTNGKPNDLDTGPMANAMRYAEEALLKTTVKRGKK